MKRRTLVAASLAAVALGGCAVHKQSMTDSYSPYYKSGSIHSVAILPSVGGREGRRVPSGGVCRNAAGATPGECRTEGDSRW